MSVAEERQCIEVVGFDPGSVAMGVGAVRFFGLYDVHDEAGAVVATVPDIEVLALERWDIERGQVFHPNEDFTDGALLNLRPGAVTRSSEMLEWGDNLARAIADANYLFTPHCSMLDGGKWRLPVLLVENQCDRQKSNYLKYQMTLIQHQISAAVMCSDYREERGVKDKASLPLARINCLGMRKYGQRSDKSRERLERKQKAVEDTKQLLAQLNSENSLKWLRWLELVEAKGEQIHDMCDGLLSAVDKSERLCELHLKAEIAQKRAFIRRIPYAPTQPPKKTGVKAKPKEKAVAKKKKTAPKEKTESKKRKRADSTSAAVVTKRKKKDTSPTPRLLLDICGDDEASATY